MEKRVFYHSKSYYVSAAFAFLMGTAVLIYPLHKFITAENDEPFGLIRVLFFFIMGFLAAVFTLIHKIKSPDMFYYMRVLKFYAVKDGEKNRWSINVLDLESVTLTDRLADKTEDVNYFPYIVFKTKSGEEYEYAPIKSPRQIKRIKNAVKFLNSCPGIPHVLNDIKNRDYIYELIPGAGSIIKH